MVGCPTCGAALRFDIASQKMACDHCGNFFETQRLADNSSRDDARSSQFDSYVYICPSCGAELLTTDKSVSEVAYAVGFTAPSYFSKCFKEEYGMVPGDIRK